MLASSAPVALFRVAVPRPGSEQPVLQPVHHGPFSHQPPTVVARLTSKQRAFLRGEAHHLKPVVQIGKEGVTEATLQAVGEAFNTRELLKVRVLDNALLDVRTVGHAIAEALDDVELIQTIGHIAVLYRPDPDAPKLLQG